MRNGQGGSKVIALQSGDRPCEDHHIPISITHFGRQPPAPVVHYLELCCFLPFRKMHPPDPCCALSSVRLATDPAGAALRILHIPLHTLVGGVCKAASQWFMAASQDAGAARA